MADTKQVSMVVVLAVEVQARDELRAWDEPGFEELPRHFQSQDYFDLAFRQRGLIREPGLWD